LIAFKQNQLFNDIRLAITCVSLKNSTLKYVTGVIVHKNMVQLMHHALLYKMKERVLSCCNTEKVLTFRCLYGQVLLYNRISDLIKL